MTLMSVLNQRLCAQTVQHEPFWVSRTGVSGQVGQAYQDRSGIPKLDRNLTINHDTPFSKSKLHTLLPLPAQCPAVIPCETVPTNKNKYKQPKPDAWVVCNEAGQAVFGNCRPWNLQQVLVLTVTSAEGEGVHLFFGARSFLRSMVQPSHPTLVMFFMFTCSCLFVCFILICFTHKHPNDENMPIACLIGFTKFMEALFQWKKSES